MLVESIAILMILIIMGFIFLRAHRKDYALWILPLIFVPLVHTAVALLAEVWTVAAQMNVRAFSDVLALAASVAGMGMLSMKTSSRKTRFAYLSLCGGFSTALTLIYLYHIYRPV